MEALCGLLFLFLQLLGPFLCLFLTLLLDVVKLHISRNLTVKVFYRNWNLVGIVIVHPFTEMPNHVVLVNVVSQCTAMNHVDIHTRWWCTVSIWI